MLGYRSSLSQRLALLSLALPPLLVAPAGMPPGPGPGVAPHAAEGPERTPALYPTARAPQAEVALGEQEAAARAAADEARRVEQEIAATEGPPTKDALRQLDQAKSKVTLTQQLVARAQAALDRIRALVAQYRKLEGLTEALTQARAEAREASDQFSELIRSGKADFQGPEYSRWRAVVDRYEVALKEYAAAYREVGRVPGGQGGGGGTLPMADRPVPPGTLPMPDRPAPPTPGSPQCANAGPPPGSLPPGSPPPGSPPPGSAAEAQRRLADAERELEAAREEVYRLDHDISHPDGRKDLGEFTAAERKMFEREKQLAAEGKSLGPHSDTYRAVLRRKVEAVAKVWKLLDQVNIARLQARQLEQAGAAPVPAPVGGDAPPQVPVLVGLGGIGVP